MFTATSMTAALITYAIYVHAVLQKYPWLGLALPSVKFGLFRYQLLVETRGLRQTAGPERESEPSDGMLGAVTLDVLEPPSATFRRPRCRARPFSSAR